MFVSPHSADSGKVTRTASPGKENFETTEEQKLDDIFSCEKNIPVVGPPPHRKFTREC